MKYNKYTKVLVWSSLLLCTTTFQVSAQTAKTVSDAEGNVYKTVTIGTQTWMAENLKATKFNDGTALSAITDFNAWRDAFAKPAYCWYKNDKTAFGKTYGALYNWYVVQPESGKNVCPVAWHVPSQEEWSTLSTYLTDSLAGGKLKESGTSHWTAPNLVSNATGFNALPAGYRSEMGLDREIGTATRFWSATEYDPEGAIAWYMILFNNNKGIAARNNDLMTIGCSIRCIKN